MMSSSHLLCCVLLVTAVTALTYDVRLDLTPTEDGCDLGQLHTGLLGDVYAIDADAIVTVGENNTCSSITLAIASDYNAIARDIVASPTDVFASLGEDLVSASVTVQRGRTNMGKRPPPAPVVVLPPPVYTG